MVKAVLVGAGRGGVSLLNIFSGSKEVEILGVADINPEAAGMKLAQGAGIFTTTNFQELFEIEGVDIVIDVTGNPEIAVKLVELKKPGMEIIGGASAKLMWNLIGEWHKREEETRRNLLCQEELYQVGLLITSTEEVEKVFEFILNSALRLTSTPAGSLALYDEKTEEFYLVTAKGFSPSFTRVNRWKKRSRGLTNQILKSGSSLVIPDVAKHKDFDNEVMLAEGVKSLIAAPLLAREKIIGIIYVDDFKPREFTQREATILSLLANQAAIAIMKTQLLEETRRLAITDSLTGLFNHRYFQDCLTREVERCKRYYHEMSLLLLDIDYFKVFNDTYGHLRGDEILKELAGVLKKMVRSTDILARYGGEEFVIILPETTKDTARRIAEKIRMVIKKHKFKGEKILPEKNLTVSVGVASYPSDAEAPRYLVEKADKALYKAKNSGRNRVCLI